ncbi:MAG: hypothetical protein JXX28_09900 [Deltaproteobacteria bacterium]|nr:hypothetical protein [Deltaproteobacteria bacterium]
MRALTVLPLVLLALGCRKGDDVPLDLDGDGYAADVDCDDTDAAVHPDAEERCNGLDDDCDAAVDEDAADAPTWYADGDGDGFGDPTGALAACAAPEGYVDDGGDCDDTSTAFHPGAPETDCADPADYNCDGSVGYADADGDGFAACEECDDTEAARYPGSEEICDGLDNDCDLLVDDDATDATAFFLDADGDGHGNASVSETTCAAPAGYVASDDDCDDLAADTFPGAPEACDGRLNDCDGSLGSDELDVDGDGFMACEGDCDDSHAAVRPGATEVCDGLDNDCDGDTDSSAVDRRVWYADTDGDTWGDAEASELACEAPQGHVARDGDCDDTEAGAHPGAAETCATAFDDDCDGQVNEADAADASTWHFDADGDTHGRPGVGLRACEAPDGYVASADDCADLDAEVYPGAEERCDGKRNDCDGGSLPADEADADRDGWMPCEDDCDDTVAAINPGALEVCNSVDDNCDGIIDTDAVNAQLWYADADNDGFGDLSSAQRACTAPTDHVLDHSDCDDDEVAAHPGAVERCDGTDNDCDGLTDEADALDAPTWYRDGDGDTWGDDGDTEVACTAPSGFVADAGDCVDDDGDIHPEATDTCDGVDNDCDGYLDEDEVGQRSSCPADSCAHVLLEDPSAPSGDYWVHPFGMSAPAEAWCDMADGGTTWWVHDGLVAYWSFDDTAFPAYDEVRDVNDTLQAPAALSTSVVMPSAFGPSMWFDNNESGRIDLISGVPFGTQYTVMFWANLESNSNNQIPILFSNESSWMGDLLYRARIYGPSGYLVSDVTAVYPSSTGHWWHHVFRDDDTDVQVWTNGAMVGSHGSNDDSFSGLSMNRIGARPGFGTNGFGGYMDDAAVFSRGLTDEEIGLIYEAGLAGYPLRW